MDAETSSGQVLEFLTVTCLPHRGVGNEEARRIVRSHAIRDANRRKRSKADLEGKQTRGAATQEPPAQSSLTTKFKLNKKPAKERKKTTPPRNEEWEYFLAGTALRRVSSSILTLAPGIGEFDPFDSLPIKLGPKQQALLDYRKYLHPALFVILSSAVNLLTSVHREMPIRAERILYRIQRSPIHLRSQRSSMAEFNPVSDFATL